MSRQESMSRPGEYVATKQYVATSVATKQAIATNVVTKQYVATSVMTRKLCRDQKALSRPETLRNLKKRPKNDILT